MKKEKLLLIDGSGLAYRAFYALPDLKTSSGFPVNAVYGFVNMLLNAIEKEKPDYVAASFDKGAPKIRMEKYEEYKATRQKQPEALSLQFPVIEEYLNILKIPVFFIEGHEADDCLATIALRAEAKDIDVLILTGDLDFLQIVNDKIKVLMMRRGIKDLKLYDRVAVRERFNLNTAQIRDFKALCGDPSDNIPGVPGVGDKTAAKLLNEFGAIENILDNLDKVAPALAKKIEENKEMLSLSKELVTLNTDLTLGIEWNKLKNQSIQNDSRNTELIGWYEKLEFKSILARIHPQASAPQAVRDKVDFTIIKTPEELNDCVKLLSSEKNCAVSLINEDGQLYMGITIKVDNAPQNYFIDINKFDTAQLIEEINKKGVKKTFSDLKLYIKAFGLFDINIDDSFFDVVLADYLLDPENTNAKLHDIVNRRLQYGILSREEMLGKGAAAKTIKQICPEDIANYLCGSSVAAGKLRDTLAEKLRDFSLDELYYKIELPLTRTLAAMEAEGIKLDVKYLESLSREVTRLISSKEKEIFSLSGTEFNINSPKQVGETLFEKMLIPNLGRTKTGYKTDAQTLQDLSFSFPIAAKILEYKELAKLKSTYIDTLPDMVDADDKLHTTYNQTGTATGRLSSSDPNLQNIPIRSDVGKQIRACFIPSKAHNLLISADYSQIELKILAHLSGDENLIKAFKDDLDIHTQTAASVFGVPFSEVTEQMRRKAKEINFGINYGMGEFGLSQRLGISRTEARNYIENYFKVYPKVKIYMENTIKAAERDGYVKTLLGRRRIIHNINSRNDTMKKQAQRVAVNAPIQGSASDIIKVAMINLYNEIKNRRGVLQYAPTIKLLLQVHDELVLEAPKEEAKNISELAARIMSDAVKLAVPVKVNVSVGENWNM